MTTPNRLSACLELCPYLNFCTSLNTRIDSLNVEIQVQGVGTTEYLAEKEQLVAEDPEDAEARRSLEVAQQLAETVVAQMELLERVGMEAHRVFDSDSAVEACQTGPEIEVDGGFQVISCTSSALTDFQRTLVMHVVEQPSDS